MAEIEVSELIAAPRETVWAHATNLDEWSETIEAITKIENLTGGPMRVGTRFRETRIMFGKEATEEMEVVEFEPPERYLVTAESHGSKYRTEVRFDAEGDGTKMTFHFHATPVSFMAKALSAVMKPMMKKMMLKCVGSDLKDMKRVCENAPTD